MRARGCIKIERPEGDFARGYDDVAKGQSSYFVWLNRGKESVVLDLAVEDDRAELGRLIARADILVQNLKPGALARLGFPIEALRKRHPSLICCSISGYGDSGPLAQRKAYDLLIQTETGLTSITGGPESPGAGGRLDRRYRDRGGGACGDPRSPDRARPER